MTVGSQLDSVPQIRLQLPGVWESDEELADRLPEGYRLLPMPEDSHEGRLQVPGGVRLEYRGAPRDMAFLKMFSTMCAPPPPLNERQIVEGHTAIVSIAGPGGSMEAGVLMAQAAAAIIMAGAGGVHCANSGRTSGAGLWITNTENSLFEGLFFNYVTIRIDEDCLWTAGMHVLGCRDALIPRRGNDERDAAILRQFLVFTYKSLPGFADGHQLREGGVEFRLQDGACTRFDPGHPAHNPYGMWSLVPIEKA